MAHDSPTLLFERYELEGILGEGGQAVVVQVVDTRLGVPRALKVMLPEMARRKSLRARFLDEARLLARIEHPNVLRVVDVNADDRTPYFVAELVTGGSLEERRQDGPVPPHAVAKVVTQVAEGLAAAHALGVVHRDVKPHNVLVTPAGLCKVVDFGIAHVDDTGRTKTGAMMGTEGYMPPEQMTDAATVDGRADGYSLAMTAAVLLTGGEPRRFLLGDRAGIPAPLDPVLTRATALAPAERYPTIEAFAEAFRTAVATLPADPPGSTAVPRPRAGRPDRSPSRLEEVRGWLVPPPAAPPTTLPSPTPATPRTPAYRMSTPVATKAPEGTPEWIAEEPELPSGFEVGLDDDERRVSQEARNRRMQQQDDSKSETPVGVEPAASAPDLEGATAVWASRVARAAMVGGVVVLLLAIVLAGWRVGYVRTEGRRERIEARDQLVAAVQSEIGMLGALEQLGSDPVVLGELLGGFESATTPEERALVAARIAEHVDREVHRLTEAGSAQRRQLEAGSLHMAEAAARWQKLPPEAPTKSAGP